MSVLGKLRGLARAGGAVMTVDQLVFSAIAFALQAAAIPVSTDAEFVNCVRLSLPYAWDRFTSSGTVTWAPRFTTRSSR
ncbi:hypothetical protein ACFQ1S_14495 [Kibdelosporangium lantanae]|uniref:PIN domain-containing protein n=1 Tax=Kibdelosporangium lantanae TaxID=1497396 RepID=A0ABW3MBM0_9PSEU